MSFFLTEESMPQTPKPHSLIWPVDSKRAQGLKITALKQDVIDAYLVLLAQAQLTQREEMIEQLEHWYLPMAGWIADKHTDTPVVFGINGAQGSGKSTLCSILSLLLSTACHKQVASFSIDDLYKTREQRKALATTVHPLLSTRGVPGTHDVTLGCSILQQLKWSAERPVLIPVFNKASDDREEKAKWQTIDSAVDIILFEGWCVGAQAEQATALQPAINQLEKEDDQDARWRTYVNQQLAGEYLPLFSLIDYLIMLKVPDMESVFEWRSLQEQKLAEATHVNDHRLMDAKAMRRFIMHYERITRALLDEMPQRADLTLYLNQRHQVDRVSMR